MNNLERIEQFDINSLSIDNTSKQVYLSHNNFPKVKDFKDKNEVSAQIDALVNFTFAYKGHSPATEREYEFTTNALKEDIFLNFNTYTIEDIKLAFKLGVRGELGEYYGLNAKTFYDWLKSYKLKYITPVTNNVIALLPKKEVPPPPKEQVDANNKIIICNVLQDFVKTKQYTFNDFGNVMYEFLLRLGIINFSKDEKNEFLKQSRVQLRIELSDRNEQLTKLGKTFHKIDLKKAFQEIEYESNKDYETQIIMLAKKNALKKFIETCADTEIDLENLINEKLEEDGNK